MIHITSVHMSAPSLSFPSLNLVTDLTKFYRAVGVSKMWNSANLIKYTAT